MHDVAIAVRVYPGLSQGALAPRKEHVVRASLRSLRNSLGDVRARIWVILDGCPPAYDELIRDSLDGIEPDVVRLDGVGNAASFLRQVNLLSEQSESDLVYCLEDDYLHRPLGMPALIGFLRDHDDVDFVSPYDHPDYTRLRLHQHGRAVRDHGGYRWQTRASTTLTFLTRRETLSATRGMFATFQRRNYDASIWLALTRKQVFNPLVAVERLTSDQLMARILAKAWLFGWRQILSGRTRTLWTPAPSVAVHMKEGMMTHEDEWMRLLNA